MFESQHCVFSYDSSTIDNIQILNTAQETKGDISSEGICQNDKIQDKPKESM